MIKRAVFPIILQHIVKQFLILLLWESLEIKTEIEQTNLQVLLSCPSDKATHGYDKDIFKRNKAVSWHPYCIGRQDKEKYERFNEKRGRFCVVELQKVGIFPKLKG